MPIHLHQCLLRVLAPKHCLRYIGTQSLCVGGANDFRLSLQTQGTSLQYHDGFMEQEFVP